MIAPYAVKKLGLKIEWHPRPSRVGWIHDET